MPHVRPIPTAPVGLTVLWKRKGKSPIGTPCVCIEEEEPGVIRLRTLDRKGEEHGGVMWEDHPSAYVQDPVGNTIPSPRVDAHGVWAYVKGETAKKAHYDLHERVLKDRAEKQKLAEQEQEDIKRRHEERQKEMSNANLNHMEARRIQEQTAAHLSQ